MRHVIIVEDEAVIARRLARLLREIGGMVGPIEIVSDFAAAGALVAAQGDSLVFLDLDLHGRDGFELLRLGLANGWRTVVVSAHAERAIEAFELGVVDFVPKPFSRERLALALSRASASAPDDRLRYLAALQGSGTTLVRLDDIVAIHGADDYSEIEVADGRRFLHRKSLQQLGGRAAPSVRACAPLPHREPRPGPWPRPHGRGRVAAAPRGRRVASGGPPGAGGAPEAARLIAPLPPARGERPSGWERAGPAGSPDAHVPEWPACPHPGPSASPAT